MVYCFLVNCFILLLIYEKCEARRNGDVPRRTEVKLLTMKDPPENDQVFPLDFEDKQIDQRYKTEMQAGDLSQWMGTNTHYRQPDMYTDLGRRFVPLYPYSEVRNKARSSESYEIISVNPEHFMENLKQFISPKTDLTFKRKKYSKPKNYQKNTLRSKVTPELLLEYIKQAVSPETDKRAYKNNFYKSKYGQGKKSKEYDRFKYEMKAGDLSTWSGTNPHYKQPDFYIDLGRRSIPVHPKNRRGVWDVDDVSSHKWSKKKKISQKFTLHSPKQALRSNNVQSSRNEDNLIPQLATPELVLSLAKQAAALEASKPRNPSDAVIQKNILRSGDYWNDVWKEDVDPGSMLRSKGQKKMKTVALKLSPDEEEYEAIMKLRNISPKLIYIINKSNE